MILEVFSGVGEVAESPFIVPVAGCIMILGLCVANVWAGTRRREMQSQERLAAIARGLPIPPTSEELELAKQGKGPAKSNLAKRRANIRLAGIILVAGAIGIAIFFLALTIILRQREILAGAATSIIPLALGIAFLIDTRIQTREIDESGAGTNISS